MEKSRVLEIHLKMRMSFGINVCIISKFKNNEKVTPLSLTNAPIGAWKCKFLALLGNNNNIRL